MDEENLGYIFFGHAYKACDWCVTKRLSSPYSPNAFCFAEYDKFQILN